VFLTALITLAVILILAAGGSYAWFNWVVDKAHRGKGWETAMSWLRDTQTTTTVAGGGATPAVDKPGSMDILLMGSDTGEADSEGYGRSDTLMLVHVDSKEDYLSVLSIPRDLRVEVPEHGMQKINAAYAFGGPALSMQVVQQLTGIKADQFVNVSFDAFRDITEALGGIYVDVDSRYYYSGLDYENINIWPGYQRLSGEAALDYVRFRHDQNYDFGRIDRQQRFLRAAKEQALGWNLVVKGPQLVTLLAQNISTSIGTTDALKLIVWAIGLNGGKIKQVYLPASEAEIDGGSYLIATDEAVANAVHDLYVAPGAKASSISPLVGQVDPDAAAEQLSSSTTTAATSTTLAKADLTKVSIDVLNANGRTGEAGLAAGRLRARGATVVTVGDAPQKQDQTVVAYPSGQKAAATEIAAVIGGGTVQADGGVKRITVYLGADYDPKVDPTDTGASGEIPNHTEWRSLAKQVSFPLMGPAYLPVGYTYSDRRIYDIDTDGGPKPALKMVYRFEESNQYLGIMETTYLDAPAALDGEKVTANGITFTIVSYGGRVDHIWWKKDGVLYWVSNTLSFLLDKGDLVQMAESMVSIPASN
jgi:polyisoprenyl-teichoic acid--peptidoglycan teichoic acid transferase